VEGNPKQSPRFLLRMLEGTMMALVYTARFLSLILPPSVLYLIPKGMGAAFYYGRPEMRRRLQAKISDGMPEITDPRVLARMGRQICGSIFMPIFDLFTLARHGERYLRDLRFVGWENLEKAEALGRGVILTGAHLGALAIVHAVMARLGKPYTPVVFEPTQTTMPRYIKTLEFLGGFLGCDVEEPAFFAGEEDIISRVRKHLSSGKRLGLNFDIGGSSIVEFFGRPAALTSGLAHFAYDTGAPVVTASLLRGRGPFDNRIVAFEPIICDPTAERKAEVARIMGEVARNGEELIRMVPGQWMSWFSIWQWWDEAQEIIRSKGAAGATRNGQPG
jgi:lauroyl/myristoyl acyltransferase